MQHSSRTITTIIDNPSQTARLFTWLSAHETQLYRDDVSLARKANGSFVGDERDHKRVDIQFIYDTQASSPQCNGK